MVGDVQIIMGLLSLLLYCNAAFLAAFVNQIYAILMCPVYKVAVNSDQMMGEKKSLHN